MHILCGPAAILQPQIIVLEFFRFESKCLPLCSRLASLAYPETLQKRTVCCMIRMM